MNMTTLQQGRPENAAERLPVERACYDLLDKLDMQRASHLLDMVSGQEFGQIFISDSDRARTAAAIDSCTTERAYFKAEGGVFTRIDG